MSQIVNLIPEEFALSGFLTSGCPHRSHQTQHISVASAPPPSLRRLSHCHSNRLSSMLSLVLLGSSALIS